MVNISEEVLMIGYSSIWQRRHFLFQKCCLSMMCILITSCSWTKTIRSPAQDRGSLFSGNQVLEKFEQLKKRFYKQPVPGPNCFHSVMYIHGYSKELRYVDATELLNFLSSRYCKKVVDPQVFPGKISIYKNELEKHAAVSIDRRNVVQKYGSAVNEKYEIKSIEEVTRQYRNKNLCRTDDCLFQSSVDFYDCERRSNEETPYLYLKDLRDVIKTDDITVGLRSVLTELLSQDDIDRTALLEALLVLDEMDINKEWRNIKLDLIKILKRKQIISSDIMILAPAIMRSPDDYKSIWMNFLDRKQMSTLHLRARYDLIKYLGAASIRVGYENSKPFIKRVDEVANFVMDYVKNSKGDEKYIYLQAALSSLATLPFRVDGIEFSILEKLRACTDCEKLLYEVSLIDNIDNQYAHFALEEAVHLIKTYKIQGVRYTDAILKNYEKIKN